MPARTPAPPPRTVPPVVRAFPTLTPFAAGPHAHDPRGVARLALSENPHGASPLALAAARAEVDFAHWYPHSDGEPLRSLLAARFRTAAEQVIVGNGADEMILLAALATAGTGRPAVTTERTFAGYTASLETAGHTVRQVPLLSDGGTDAAAVRRALAGAGCVMVCNPHNPTGTALNPADVSALVDAARKAGAVLVLDEAYAEFADPVTFGSGLDHLDGGRVVVLRTFSKAYGLAGLRAGYAVGDRDVIQAMATIRTALPYNTNRVALAAAAAALSDSRHLKSVVDDCAAARRALAAELDAMAVRVLPSQTNFLLAHLGPCAGTVVDQLAAEHRVHIRHTAGLGFPNWARISVPAARDVPHLAAVLRSVLPAHRSQEART
ncbi:MULTISPECIES: pyridoxal phosphate-dependent aminotransferase [Streptomyces]|uniref:Pyridoxal phosphate-dependent aminotransferase n=2 Tax=Streptomyces TaxID=1883 RepID=A0ABV9J9N1_9ACTN